MAKLVSRRKFRISVRNQKAVLALPKTTQEMTADEADTLAYFLAKAANHIRAVSSILTHHEKFNYRICRRIGSPGIAHGL